MGTNTLTDYSSTPVPQTVADRMDQYRNSLLQDHVPRNSSGVPAADAGKLGTSTYPWSEANVTAININGTPFDPSNLNTENNQISSGAVRSGSSQPLFLQAAGSSNSVSILGATTTLSLTINSTAVTFTTDVSVSSLTTAPSSNNTCLINNTDFSDQEFTKYVTTIDYDTAGSEITGLDGEFAAFSVGSTEYFIAKIDNTNSQLKVYQRGFFFDSSNAPVERVTLANNDTITLMQLVWIYADNSGTSASVGYTTPTYSASEPSGASTNDYWFDLSSEEWKRYDGAAWQVVNRILIGYAVCDNTNCVATRCIDFTKAYSDYNTLQVEKATDSTLQTVGNFEQCISVYGSSYYYNGRITWGMATDLESGVVEASSTFYYLYITNSGNVKISDQVPNFYKNRRGGYHPFHTWRFIARAYNDASGDLEAAINHFLPNERIIFEADSYLINPNGIDYAEVYAIGAGGSNGAASDEDGADTIFNFDLTADGGHDVSASGGGTGGGGGGSFSGADLGYNGGDGGVSTAAGITNNVFKHLLQLSEITSTSASPSEYGAGAYIAPSGGGAGGSAYKQYYMSEGVYDVSVNSNKTGGAMNGVCLIIMKNR